MKKNIIFDLTIRGLLSSLFLICCATHAQMTGYRESLVAEVLISPDLDRDAVLPASDGTCIPGYEIVPGTHFCLQPRVSLTRQGKYYLASRQAEIACKAGYSRPRANSTLCLDNDFGLAWINEELTLIIQQCPRGFVEAQTLTGCAATTETTSATSTVQLRCKPGYMTVESLNVCVANYVVLKTGSHANFGIQPTQGVCEHGRKRVREGGFCVPARALSECDADLDGCDKDNRSAVCLASVENMDCCPLENLSVHEIPRFEGGAFTTEEIFSCALGPGSVIPNCDDLDLDLIND